MSCGELNLFWKIIRCLELTVSYLHIFAISSLLLLSLLSLLLFMTWFPFWQNVEPNFRQNHDFCVLQSVPILLKFGHRHRQRHVFKILRRPFRDGLHKKRALVSWDGYVVRPDGLTNNCDDISVLFIQNQLALCFLDHNIYYKIIFSFNGSHLASFFFCRFNEKWHFSIMKNFVVAKYWQIPVHYCRLQFPMDMSWSFLNYLC